MHFDDRLGTVLRLSASGGAVLRIQFRQLLDLLGTSPAEARGDQLDAAYVRLGELEVRIPPAERTAIIRDSGLRLRSPRLVAALAQGDAGVAAAAVLRARLDPDQWLDLVPALPPSVRPALRERRDLDPQVSGLLARLGVNDRALPGVASPVDSAPSVAPVQAAAPNAAEATSAPDREEPLLAEPIAVLPAQPGNGESGIGAIVKRIESYRRAKQVIEQTPANDAPRLPLGEEHVLRVPEQVRAFDFASNAEGRIVWSDPGVAPMVLGMNLLAAAKSPELAVQARRHQPLRAEPLDLAGAEAIAGAWQLDAGPWFDPLSGRFLGYRGRLRRPAESTVRIAPVGDSEADRIRQVLHELRTPVNAIQIGAEIIQQQLFGTTPHEYRALAAGIAGDAARMLSAFEELERLAKLDSGSMELEPGTADLAEVVAATVAQLGAHTAQRGSGFALPVDLGAWLVGLDRLELERVAWRLLATLAGVSAPGERLKLKFRERGGMIRLDLALPATLAAREGDALFDAAAGAIPQVIAAGVFGVGFALRLARAEARAAGGDLVRKDDRLRLTLPGLTVAAAGHTEGRDKAASIKPRQ